MVTKLSKFSNILLERSLGVDLNYLVPTFIRCLAVLVDLVEVEVLKRLVHDLRLFIVLGDIFKDHFDCLGELEIHLLELVMVLIQLLESLLNLIV